MPNLKPLKILLTNHHLFAYHGTENFTYVIADYLKQRGQEVTVYSPYLGKLKDDFKALGIDTVNHIEKIKGKNFDVAHVHHQINAYEVRFHFPQLPIILLSHGVVFLETPPIIDLKVSQYLATSERVKNNMVKAGVAEEKIAIFRNLVDPKVFFPTSQLPERPKKALIISNKIGVEKESTIREACRNLNISTKFIGERFQKVKYSEMPHYLNQTDIVFSLGRGVIEAMFCGKVPVVFDFEGGDGMVTPYTITQNMTCNFSGNVHNANYTIDQLIDIIKQYNVKEAQNLHNLALEYFSAEKRIDDLISIYRQHVGKKVEELPESQKKVLFTLVSTISETRKHTIHFEWTSLQEDREKNRSFLKKLLRKLFK